jgi:hypothetical protein
MRGGERIGGKFFNFFNFRIPVCWALHEILVPRGGERIGGNLFIFIILGPVWWMVLVVEGLGGREQEGEGTQEACEELSRREGRGGRRTCEEGGRGEEIKEEYFFLDLVNLFKVTKKQAVGCGIGDLKAICWDTCMIEHHFEFGCFDLTYKDYLP